MEIFEETLFWAAGKVCLQIATVCMYVRKFKCFKAAELIEAFLFCVQLSVYDRHRLFGWVWRGLDVGSWIEWAHSAYDPCHSLKVVQPKNTAHCTYILTVKIQQSHLSARPVSELPSHGSAPVTQPVPYVAVSHCSVYVIETIWAVQQSYASETTLEVATDHLCVKTG